MKTSFVFVWAMCLGLVGISADDASRKELNYLKNGYFKIKTSASSLKDWNLRGTKDCKCLKILNEDKETFIRLNAPSKESVILIQRRVKLIPGNTYELSCNVRSMNKNRFRIYAEWRQPDPATGKSRLKSFGGFLRKASPQWQKDKITFYFPKDACQAYVVINVRDLAEADFKDIKLILNKDKIVKGPFGGIWKFIGKGKFEQAKNTKDILLEVKSNSGRGGAILQDINLKPGARYRFSFSVIGKGEAGSATGFYPFRVYVILKTNNQRLGGIWDDTWNSSFQNKELIFSVPKELKDAKANIVFETKSKGSILFKNMNLETTVSEKPRIFSLNLKSPFFRNSIFSSDKNQNISGELQVLANVKTIKVTLRDAGKNEIIRQLQLAPKDLRAKFVIQADALPCAKYLLTISAYAENNTLLNTAKEYIKKLPPALNEVVYCPDNRIYINGKPFLPVLFWKIIGLDEKNNDVLYWASRNGINAFITRPATELQCLKILDRAHKYGMKVFIATDFAPRMDKDTFRMWEHRLCNLLTLKVMKHPALLGYVLADEPFWCGKPLKNLIASYKIIKSIDPYHPVWVNAAPRGAVAVHRKYSQAADIYGADIYPIPYPNSHSGLEDKNMTCVGKYVSRMRKAIGHNKPIFMALQGFAWRAWDKNVARDKLVYPKYFETRFMAYDAIVSGACSIGYWGTQWIEKAGFFEQLYKICRELQQISGVLTKAELVETVRSDNSKIVLKSYQYSKNVLIIAINRSSENQKTNISGIKGFKKLNILNENHQIKLEDGQFSDEFLPYDVNIYSSGNLLKPAYQLPPVNLKMEKSGNPMLHISRNANDKIYYKGRANWIWEASSMQKPYSEVWLCREFKLNRGIASGKLIVSADDDYIIYVNGRKVGEDIHGSGKGWSVAEEYDCTKLLKKGLNHISAYARDAGVIPCGFIADLSVKLDNGENIKIISDTNWRASNVKPAKFPLLEKTGKFSPAVIIAPYGAGAWGKKLTLPKQ
jgi:hypothetical protein